MQRQIEDEHDTLIYYFVQKVVLIATICESFTWLASFTLRKHLLQKKILSTDKNRRKIVKMTVIDLKRPAN